MIKNNLQTGFTLVEVILYVAIVASFISVLSFFFLSIQTTNFKQDAIRTVEDQAKIINQELERLVFNATDINIPTLQNSGDTLSLDMIINNVDPTIITLDGDNLTIKQGTDPAESINTDDIIVSNLEFIHIGDDGFKTLQYSYQLDFDNGEIQSGNYQRNYSGTINQRLR